MSARIIKYIFCNEQRKGEGTDGDPVRLINQLFDMEGNLIAQYDTWSGESFFNGDSLR